MRARFGIVCLLLGCGEQAVGAAPAGDVDASDARSVLDGDASAARDASGSDAGAPDARAGTDAAAPCRAVQRYTFPFPSPVALSCGAGGPRLLVDAQVPAHGRALGRARFVARHVGAGTSTVTHFWNARVELGKIEQSFGIGDDLCPGTRAQRENLGVGALEAGNDRARVWAYQGSSPCTEGAVEILSGALDVWVEAPEPECRGRDIAVGSYYATAGTTAPYAWTTSMTRLVSTSLTTVSPAERLLVLSVVEGSPALDPNTVCGAEAATLVSQTTLDRAVLSTSRDVVPASQGMGHLVLSSEAEQPVGPGAHTIELLVGSNFTGTVTTGGCCGDGTVAAIRLR